jgi:methyl-accepting chemotaxis protein
MESIAPGESVGMGTSAEQLADEIGLDGEEIAWRKEFVGFDDEDAERLAAMSEVVEAREADLVDAFLEPIYGHRRTQEVVDRSPRDDEALRAIVSGYLRMLTGGSYDEEYFTHRCRIGRLHDRLDMPLHYFGGMFANLTNILLDEIEALTVEAATDEAAGENEAGVAAAIEEGFANARAAVRGTNLDMQVVNDTYLHSYSQEMRDEVGASREMRDSVAGDVETMREDTETAAESAAEIRSLAEEQSEDVSRLADEVSDMSATIEEVAATADTVAETSERAERLAEDGRDAAAETMETIEAVDDARGDVTDDVDALVDAIDEINGIVEVIDDIAEQTNMLALNASIEAARAGDAGSGFAVVAEEVKQLADESKTQATRVEEVTSDVTARIDETADNLDRADEAISRGLDEVERTMGNLEDIVDAASEAATGIEEVARATDEQAAGASELASTVDTVSRQAEDVATEAETVARRLDSQTETANRLDRAVTELRDRTDQSTGRRGTAADRQG